MAMRGSYLLNIDPIPDGHIPEKAAKRIRKVGDWYNRMEGCLENHDKEPHTFGITDISNVKMRQSVYNKFSS